MAAITLETVAAWLQQQNREGQASTGNEEGQANIGSTGMCMEDSSSEVSLSLLEQPQGSQVCKHIFLWSSFLESLFAEVS
jgi:hypothetical protein